jgi:peptide/histidine transporter 3/4
MISSWFSHDLVLRIAYAGGEFCGALAYYAVGTNLVSYLTKVQHQSNVEAASRNISWQGTCYLASPLGAFLADSYWGRHRTIIVSLSIFTLVSDP